MKNIIFLVSILAITLFLAPAKAQVSKEDEKVKLVVKPILQVEREFAKIDIVPGESEYTKRENENKNSTQRTLVARERSDSAPAVSYDLGGLRTLYREAGGKYGVDWKLIEAVHQVETGKSTDTCKSSYAGATGPMQFLPSTFRHYADEGSDICNLRDSVFAAANLLAQAGASSGDIDSALFSYNHSRSYVELVKSVMNSI